jgi:uncharacterized protein (TIGR03435 family)
MATRLARKEMKHMNPATAVAILAVFPAWEAFCQPPANPTSFEVVDVKISKSTNSVPSKERFLPGGRVELPNFTMRSLIMGAYSVRENMVTGGPNWLDSDRFDVVAKAAADTPLATLRLMIQTMLAERFKLAIHREAKVMPVYALVVGKRGPSLQQAAGSGRPNCTSRTIGVGVINRDCHNLTMADLALQLPGLSPAYVDLPVVDLSDLKGGYDFSLEYSVRGRGDAGRSGDGAGDSTGATMFEAVEQLGLKLEPRKLAVSVIVIDHVERVPTGN